MGRLTILALRVVIAIAFVGSLVVQGLMVPLLWIDLEDAPASVRVPVAVIVILGVGTLQVLAVCIWRLLTMVRRDTVFSHGAFRYVDVMIGAIATAAVLAFAMAVTLAPGEDVAPGIVGLICGISLTIGGFALLMLVMRQLLAQATQLRSELDEVI